MAPAASLRFLRLYFDDVDLVSVRISHGQTPILTGLQFPIDILEERTSELRSLTPGRDSSGNSSPTSSGAAERPATSK
jgi:hypothetical protein